ncbi:MAG TPA: serine/threonine-protein kinase [Gemmatimonadaceae bacterium]|nr:serine/threonine-protein kinase [Gemmatimonadaceae bacterium]
MNDSDTATVTPPPDGRPVELEAVKTALAGDYEILSELGRGGMAVVYRAREKELDREVAIKVLPAAMTFDNDFVERFQREARTAGKLEHPHIVPIYRVGRAGAAGNVIYFVMKLLTGQSLATVLRDRKKLTVHEVRRIILETASALGYAAKRGVVHRDIKPDNILLDSEGRCVVTDFGIAKTAHGPMTAAGTSMGTPRYMSPEHAQGGKVDGRSDIYSLGVVAYQCLTGKTPFDADDPFAVLFKHINEPIPRPELETDEEWALYAVIERMLAKKQEDRYQDAEALIQALGGEVQTITLVNPQAALQTTFGPTEIIPTPMPWRRRRSGPMTNQTWAIVGVAIAALLMVSVADALLGPSVGGIDTIAAATPQAAGTTPLAPGAGATTAAVASPPVTPTAAAQVAAVTPKPVVPKGPESKCPRTRTALREMGSPGLLVDSLKDLTLGSRLAVSYDVCNIAAGQPYNAHFTLTKHQRNPFGKMKPLVIPFVEVSSSNRMRLRKQLDVSELDEGNYTLKVAVSNRDGVVRELTRPLRIVKPQPPTPTP